MEVSQGPNWGCSAQKRGEKELAEITRGSGYVERVVKRKSAIIIKIMNI
jgi:hypothetical protein